MRAVLAAAMLVAIGLTAFNLATSPKAPMEMTAEIHDGARSGAAALNELSTVCLKAETLSRSWLALDAGDYETSNRLIAGRDCAKLSAGQPVTLTGRWTDLPVGKAASDLFRFVEFALPSGDLVWGFERSIN